MIKSVEDWGWPQAIAAVGIAASVAFCVWCFFYYLSR